jgi:AcrR family transcriptional regulator
MPRLTPVLPDDGGEAEWHRRVVGRSLRTATKRSLDRGQALVQAAATVLERSNGEGITVQEVADEAGQSLRTLYQYFESKDDLLLAVFEEAMRTYALLIRRAIEPLDDPLDRLGAAMIAAVTIPMLSDAGFDRGLARLRLRLAESQPELVGRSQASTTGLVRELVEEASAAGRIRAEDPDAATFMLLSLNAAVITTERLGNDIGVRRPDPMGVVLFCLQGLGADLEPGYLEGLAQRLQLPGATPSRTPRRRSSAKKATTAGSATRKASTGKAAR